MSNIAEVSRQENLPADYPGRMVEVPSEVTHFVYRNVQQRDVVTRMRVLATYSRVPASSAVSKPITSTSVT
jgi:hypothetical protein